MHHPACTIMTMMNIGKLRIWLQSGSFPTPLISKSFIFMGSSSWESFSHHHHAPSSMHHHDHDEHWKIENLAPEWRLSYSPHIKILDLHGKLFMGVIFSSSSCTIQHAPS